MKVNNLSPNPGVSEYVERILIIENTQTSIPFSLPLFANGSPTLLFISSKAIMGNRPAAHLTLFGQTIVPETLSFSEGFILIAYFFKPYALISLFGIMAPELTDAPLDLHLLGSKKTKQLQEKLLNSGSTEISIAFLDDFILGLMKKPEGDCPKIKYAANKIMQQPSPEILKTVQKELHVTERTFQRLFEKHIGIAPNLYRRVCQFHSAFQQLNSRKFLKLSDLAFQNGYADQSHYVRSFKEFTHLLPSEFLSFGEPPNNA